MRPLHAQSPAFPIASPAAAACPRPQAGRGRQRFARKSLPGEGAATALGLGGLVCELRSLFYGAASADSLARIIDRFRARGLRWRADERESSYGDAIFSKAFGRKEQLAVFKRELHAPGGRPDARQRSTAARRDHLSAGLTTCVYTQYLPSASGPRRVAERLTHTARINGSNRFYQSWANFRTHFSFGDRVYS